MEIDQATRDIFTELEIQRKFRDDPNFKTKQLLKNNTCLNCWRLMLTADWLGRYYCGAPQTDGNTRVTKEVEGKIIESPETETCEYFIAKRNNEGSSS